MKGKKKEEYREDIRDLVIANAGKIFSRFGFKKTTMDEIAQAARKGKSSIYYYFTSKEEIFEAVVEREASQLRASLAAAISESKTPQEKLNNYIIARMKGFKKLVNFYDAVKNDYLTYMPFVEKLKEEFDTTEAKTIEEFLKEGVSKKAFKIEDTKLVAISLITVLKGLEMPLFINNEDVNIEQSLQDLMNIIFFGIIKR